ncbi:MAG TPA: hypothetical protein VGF23_17405 [Gaiellaceae bacterium]
MSVYDWPEVSSPGEEREDDPFGRRGYVSRRRVPIDQEEALAAGRTLAVAPPPKTRRRRRKSDMPMLEEPLRAPAHEITDLWLPLGPTVMLKGQAANKPRVSGRVRAIAVHPNGQRVYAAAANGGIWYSKDGGGSWASIGGFAATNTAGITRPAHRNACGAVLARFDPAHMDDETKDLVLVGTGETTPGKQARPGSELGGVGIFTATGPAASTDDDPWTLEAPNLAGDGVYRLAAQPGGTTIVAATSSGLFQRPDAPGAGVNWTQVADAPFNGLTDECTDVLWTAAGGGFPARLWVWVVGGKDNNGLWVRPDGGAFTRIKTPGAYNQVSALAASEPAATRVYVLNNRYYSGDAVKKAPGLYQIDGSGNAVADTAPQVLDGVPDVLRDQGDYDITIAVDPGNANRVAIAGSYLEAQNPAGLDYESYNGSIVVAEVGVKAGRLTFGHPTPLVMVGIGAHADVHDLRYSNGGATLWTACDGGVFRSDRPTQQVGFFARNDGLSIAEANFIASHPTCEGYVVVGLQDNGTVERASTNVWRLVEEGDGGGLAFDPTSTERWVAQYVQATWNTSSGGSFDTMLTRGNADKADDEDKASAFYSSPGAIKHTRPSGDVGQILIGTDRVWYTEDWGTTWATLPTGTDPIKAATYDRGQDKLDESVYVCRFASPDVAWILTGPRFDTPGGKIYRLERTAGSADAGGPGTWTKPAELIAHSSPKGKKETLDAFHRSAAWTDLAVNLDAGGTQHGTKGAVYLATAGRPGTDDVDTLWWFDGTDTWHPTGLRKNAVPAPATAVLCDPANPDHVYVGTTVGVWRGTRTLPDGQPPSWAWETLVNGLPEAAVEDLSLFDFDGVRLLRAAIAARGVWELDLGSSPSELCYLRAHDDDQRRRPRALEKKRDGVSDRSWHASPDVRPRIAPAVITKPTTLPWTLVDPAIDTETLRRFQAALRSQANDPRSRATGVWDLYFEEVLRDHGGTVNPNQTVNLDSALWDTVMVAPHATAEPWGAGVPSEADLYELVAELNEGEPGSASASMPPQQLKVDVVVHRRSIVPVDGADVRVTLLQWIDPSAAHRAKYDDATTWFSGNVPWTQAVNDVLNSSGGTTGASFGAGWAFVGSGANRRKTLAGQTIDNLRSGVVTFDINLLNARQDLLLLLVAVIREGGDIALDPTPLKDLALTSPNVAVRSVRVNPST